MEYFHKRGVNHRHQAGKSGRGLEGRLALTSQLERGTPTSQPDQEIHVLLILCLFTLPEFLIKSPPLPYLSSWVQDLCGDPSGSSLFHPLKIAKSPILCLFLRVFAPLRESFYLSTLKLIAHETTD
jgi:hypothetical protein